MAKKFQIPKTLGACADRLYELHAQKSKAQKVVDDLRAEEAAIEKHLIDKLPSDDAEGIVGKVAKVVVRSDVVPTVEAAQWSKVYAYIAKNKAFELLQKRLNSKAVKERWEDGKTIPGVSKFNAKKISLTKK